MNACIIQARMGSNRLPDKIMKKIDEKTVLDYVIDQLEYSNLIDKIIIATTLLEEDQIIVDFAKSRNLDYFQGNTIDVLDRFYQCAKKFSIDEIIRVTSDCPLIDPVVVDDLIKFYYSKKFDYVSNKYPKNNSTFPQGTEVEMFSITSFEKVWKNAKKKSEREHVTPYYYNHSEIFKNGGIKNGKNLSHLRWTVDRTEDLKVVKSITAKIKKRPIQINDIVELFSKFPHIPEMNKHYIRNEGYLKSIKED